MKLYLVGGAVRDFIMGVPVKDKDYVAVGATEQDFASKGFQKLSKKDISVFLDPVSKCEIALARKEDKYDLRNKIVKFSYDKVTIVEDLYRRDFTINAMAMDEDSGEIIDPFDGQLDIQKKVLKHVSPRFEEDPLRILRGYRFAERYGFSIVEETKELFKMMIERGDLKYVQNGRLYLELSKAGDIQKFLSLVDNDGFLNDFFPESKIFKTKVASPEEALVNLYLNTQISKELIDKLVFFGFEKKRVQRLSRLTSYTDLFTLLAKEFKVDQYDEFYKEVQYFFKLKDAETLVKIDEFVSQVKALSFDEEKSKYEGKELGDKILEKKRDLFKKVFKVT